MGRLNEGEGSKNENIISKSSKDTLEGGLKRCVSNTNSKEKAKEGEDLLEGGPLKRCKLEDVYGGRPCEGERLDVKRFLSTNYLVRSNGNKVALDAVLGKHLVICCVSLPISEGHQYFNSMVTSYSELSRDDFEMVLVPDANLDKDDKSLYNDFFSKLPCLAVPFSESHTRANICSFIGFNWGAVCPRASSILIDPNQTILHCDMTIYHFHDFVADWFPFLQTTIKDIETQDRVLRFRLDPTYPKHTQRLHPIPSDAYLKDPRIREPLSLEELLLCDPSLVLPITVGSGSVTVSELRNKYVALYLCHSDLTLILDLQRALQPHLKRDEDLVIVVVCIPFYETIQEMQNGRMKGFFEKFKVPTFFHPNNTKVWRSLWRVFADSSMEDELIILPPKNSLLSGDLYGKAVVENLLEKGYPFARTALLRRTLTALRSLAPASLFKGTTVKERTCLIRNGGKSSVALSEIEGRRLLIYVGTLSDSDWTEWWVLTRNYHKVQAMGWEVVFVPLDTEGEVIPEMPWPAVPFSDAVKTRQLLFPCMSPEPKIFAFESDGRMVSTQIYKKLTVDFEFNDSLFNDNLDQDIYYEMYSLQSNT